MEERLRKLEDMLLQQAESNRSNPPAVVANISVRPRNQDWMTSPTQNVTDTGDAALDLSCSLGAFPASSITTTLSTGTPVELPSWPDLISRGIITLSSAEQHLAFFKQYLDPSMHYALGVDCTIASIRARSSLLLTAICTVSSLCMGSQEYSACFDELKEEVQIARLMLKVSGKNDHDLITGLFSS